MHTLNRVLRFLAKLEDHRIYYRLEHSREDSLMIKADVPGEKWEIEFMGDGTMEIEVFTSDGEIKNESVLRAFFKKLGDKPLGDPKRQAKKDREQRKRRTKIS